MRSNSSVPPLSGITRASAPGTRIIRSVKLASGRRPPSARLTSTSSSTSCRPYSGFSRSRWTTIRQVSLSS